MLYGLDLALQGAMTTFTKGLGPHLISRGIRVNAIAPGAVWTPLILQSYPPEQVTLVDRPAHCCSQSTLSITAPLSLQASSVCSLNHVRQLSQLYCFVMTQLCPYLKTLSTSATSMHCCSHRQSCWCHVAQCAAASFCSKVMPFMRYAAWLCLVSS